MCECASDCVGCNLKVYVFSWGIVAGGRRYACLPQGLECFCSACFHEIFILRFPKTVPMHMCVYTLGKPFDTSREGVAGNGNQCV